MRGESSEGKSLIIFSSNYSIDFLEGTVTASLDTTSPATHTREVTGTRTSSTGTTLAGSLITDLRPQDITGQQPRETFYRF